MIILRCAFLEEFCMQFFAFPRSQFFTFRIPNMSSEQVAIEKVKPEIPNGVIARVCLLSVLDVVYRSRFYAWMMT